MLEQGYRNNLHVINVCPLVQKYKWIRPIEIYKVLGRFCAFKFTLFPALQQTNYVPQTCLMELSSVLPLIWIAFTIFIALRYQLFAVLIIPTCFVESSIAVIAVGSCKKTTTLYCLSPKYY